MHRKKQTKSISHELVKCLIKKQKGIFLFKDRRYNSSNSNKAFFTVVGETMDAYSWYVSIHTFANLTFFNGIYFF